MNRRDVVAPRPARGLLPEIVDADDIGDGVYATDEDGYLMEAISSTDKEKFMAPLALALHAAHSDLTTLNALFETYHSQFLTRMVPNRISAIATTSRTAAGFFDDAPALEKSRQVLGYVGAWRGYVAELVECARGVYEVWSGIWSFYEELCDEGEIQDSEEMDIRMGELRQTLRLVEARRQLAVGCANEARGLLYGFLGEDD